MKATSLVMIAFLGLVSCFSPPEYPVTPNIEFSNIVFVDVPDGLVDKDGFTIPDTLLLSVKFKDGDGDIGLYDADLEDPQYAEKFYFKLNDTRKYVNPGGDIEALLKEPNLLRYKTKRTVAKYDTLPNFVKPYDCISWQEIKKTINNKLTPVDTIYFQLNPNFYNIFVDFLIKQPDGSWQEYDFRKEFCTTYDGRMPILAKDQGDTPLQGTIRYAMQSTAFKLIFSIKTLKLRVKIQDRALNKSNEIETVEFRLSDITKK